MHLFSFNAYNELVYKVTIPFHRWSLFLKKLFEICFIIKPCSITISMEEWIISTLNLKYDCDIHSAPTQKAYCLWILNSKKKLQHYVG